MNNLCWFLWSTGILLLVYHSMCIPEYSLCLHKYNVLQKSARYLMFDLSRRSRRSVHGVQERWQGVGSGRGGGVHTEGRHDQLPDLWASGRVWAQTDTSIYTFAPKLDFALIWSHWGGGSHVYSSKSPWKSFRHVADRRFYNLPFR